MSDDERDLAVLLAEAVEALEDVQEAERRYKAKLWDVMQARGWDADQTIGAVKAASESRAAQKEREWLKADRAYVQGMVDACADDDPSGTRRLMWQNRLEQINEDIAALGAAARGEGESG